MRPERPTTPTPPARGRRGVTLLEMLVTVALLVLIMSILVAIFQSATGAIDVQQKFAVIDQDLRRVESTLRSDLGGVTAPLDPPLNPNDNLGYFTLEENRFADYQGEDIDDVIAFTAKAPPGQPFVGRVWIAKTNIANNAAQTVEPVNVTSDFAEIIIFTRNGNLYRRVLLVKPDLQETLGLVIKAGGPNRFKINNIPNDYALTNPANPANQVGGFTTSIFGPVGTVSWLGMNDISCRPSPVSPSNPWPVPIPNSLGDLTNRENRFASPRFRGDFFDLNTGGLTDFGDGVDDDLNLDGVPDYYPTLHPAAFTARGILAPLVFEPTAVAPRASTTSRDVHGFPWVFPGMFSYPRPGVDPAASYQLGLIRDGYTTGGVPFFHGAITLDVGGTQVNLPIYNQNPLEIGESTIPPNAFAAGVQTMPAPSAAQLSTWWGRPTWKETMAASWTDPWFGVRVTATPPQAFPLSWDRVIAGGALPLSILTNYPNSPAAGTALPSGFENVWEDDLLLTGVRSFDVKVYDDNAGYYGNASDYYDLGYAGLTAGTPLTVFTPKGSNPREHHEPREPLGFGHEGRMPPRLGTTLGGNDPFDGEPLGPIDGDNRVNPAWPSTTSTGGTPIRNQVGDNVAETIRMARTYDTWSTDYTNAPSLPVDPSTGPYNGLPPTLPSYPAPYPVPLTGIQIQIRAVDPANQHIRTLTIKHDFDNTRRP